ncbi:hypothetical protein PNK_1064 [Candidatus Protochlamydia naegleriophila]|uniref:Protochlamydia outer membrane protein domain-containing protein n=1 Tax=Candidatus Protochlamydia naegleriophila TaxID=389348 RepID=A0A0U5J9H6_9BACT|nr:hypothetical protein [Candidatus Protochlamydia naegleriophila]CUI16681.1 hypothetical protein PNK_1064 [Candidatus Protochlamydia naegleriophila]
MSLKKHLIFTLFFFSLCSSYVLHSELLGFDLKLTNGYRNDSLSTSVESNDSYSLLAKDDLKLDSISLYQLGFKGRLSLLDFLVRVDANYGWAVHGKCIESQLFDSSSPSHLRANIRKGWIKEATFGIGYQFNLIPFCQFFTITPMGGWSYHEQFFKSSHLHGYVDANNLTYTNRWEGPWCGIDLECRLHEFVFNAGYEYHLVDWHGKRKLSDLQSIRKHFFSDRHHSDHAHGQVFYIDSKWNFNLCWYVGLGLKLQEWKAIKGHWKPISGFSAYSNEERIKQTKWRSFAITIDLGVNI